MSAGSGVQHSEFNGSHQQPVHFLQIWILPNVAGIPAGYEEKHFGEAEKRGRLCLIASPGGARGSVHIHQDAQVYAGLLDGAEQSQLRVGPGRLVYAHVARGRIVANGEALEAGDALKLTGEPELRLGGGEAAEVIVFDLPADTD
jgi:redox-sensitive bicupin YhaK (pirin superfamily)